MAITRATFPLPDTDDALTEEFFAGAARSELLIPRCERCAIWAWYPTAACGQCAGPLIWTATRGTGTLFTWVVVERAFLPAFAEQVPFVTALVVLDEDPRLRIPTYLVDCEPAQLVAEMRCVVAFRPLAFPTVPDRSVIVPMFTPMHRLG